MNNLIYANSKVKYYEKTLLTDSFLYTLAKTVNYEDAVNQLISSRYIPAEYKDKSIDEISKFKEEELTKKMKDLKADLPPFNENTHELRTWYSLINKLKSNNKKEENKKIEFLKTKKADVFGLYPIFAYHYAFLSEIRNIRIILTGKRLGVPYKDIEERLCITYV